MMPATIWNTGFLEHTVGQKNWGLKIKDEKMNPETMTARQKKKKLLMIIQN
jgi:hypothetical protein